jgi:hypothetical protein
LRPRYKNKDFVRRCLARALTQRPGITYANGSKLPDRPVAWGGMEAVIAQPAVAIETLENLAKWQSDTDDPERDAEPGKMPHELRVGEWAHFGLVPHRPYYGTADATPLYLLLLAEKQGGLPVSRRISESPAGSTRAGRSRSC